MPPIGETLRRHRLRRGLTLDEVAERIRINTRLLEALEEEDWEKLPGQFFARAFLRQYAAFLDVEPDLVSAELARWEQPVEAELPAPAPEARHIAVPPLEPDPRTRREALRRSLGSMAVLVLAVAVCAALYAVWEQWHASPAPAGVPVAAPSGPAALPPQAVPKPSAPVAPSPAPAAPISLDIQATEEVWGRVVADGKVVFSDTLQPGQSRAFQAQGTMNLLVGNAGGLAAIFNGKPLGPLGPRGQIRVLELTPSEHRILERKPPPEP